jgi:hypothetical protein
MLEANRRRPQGAAYSPAGCPLQSGAEHEDQETQPHMGSPERTVGQGVGGRHFLSVAGSCAVRHWLSMLAVLGSLQGLYSPVRSGRRLSSSAVTIAHVLLGLSPFDCIGSSARGQPALGARPLPETLAARPPRRRPLES